MKKFTALMLVAICLIVGGVYATWSYSQGKITTTLNPTASATIQASTSATEKGTITLTTNNIAFEITDNKKGTETVGPNVAGDYIAEVEATGSIVVTFVAAAGADAAVIANGITLKINLTVPSNPYEGKAIFAAATTEFTSTSFGTFAPVTGSAGTFTWTITAADLLGKLTFNGGEDLVLDTVEEYEAFKAALGTYKITMVIAEA